MNAAWETEKTEKRRKTINDRRQMHVFAGKHERKTWVFVNNYQEVRSESSNRPFEVDTHAVPRSDCFNQGLKISFKIGRLHLGTRFAVATNVFRLFTAKRLVSLSNWTLRVQWRRQQANARLQLRWTLDLLDYNVETWKPRAWRRAIGIRKAAVLPASQQRQTVI